MQPRTHRADGTAQDLGDRRVGQLFQVAERDDLAMLPRPPFSYSVRNAFASPAMRRVTCSKSSSGGLMLFAASISRLVATNPLGRRPREKFRRACVGHMAATTHSDTFDVDADDITLTMY